LLHRFIQVQQEHSRHKHELNEDAKQKSPLAFEAEALQNFFKELDKDQDGFVTPRDLITWCTSVSCQSLVDVADLESLFQASLPDFNSSSSTAPTSSAAPHVALEVGQDSDVDDVIGVFEEPVNVDDIDNGSFLMAHQAIISSLDEVPSSSLTQAAKQSSKSNGLNEKAFSAALVRRPLLSARLVLMRRFSLAVKPMLEVEAFANEALATADTAMDAAKSELQCVAWQDTCEILVESKKSADSDASVVQDLEASIKEAEAKDPRSATSHAVRRALQEHFLMVARQNRALLTIELALEVKLLAWHEAEHCPTQLQQLQALPPLYTFCPQPSLAESAAEPAVSEEALIMHTSGSDPAAAATAAATAEADTYLKRRLKPAREPSFMEKVSGVFDGSRWHFNKMAESFDEEGGEVENGGTGSD
jgi:hypothetical protein